MLQLPAHDPFTMGEVFELNDIPPKAIYSRDIVRPISDELRRLGFKRYRKASGYIWTKNSLELSRGVSKEVIGRLGLKPFDDDMNLRLQYMEDEGLSYDEAVRKTEQTRAEGARFREGQAMGLRGEELRKFVYGE